MNSTPALRADVARIDDWLVVPCYADPTVRWNGFACPWFSLESVRTIAEKINADDSSRDYLQITEGGDRPEVVMVTLGEGDEHREVLEPILSPAGAWLWPVGSYAWVWALDSDYPAEVDGVEVARRLTEAGWEAYWEYPGFLMVCKDGCLLNTGQHGWEYANVEADANGGGEVGTVTLEAGRYDLTTVEGVVTAWHDVLTAWDMAGDVSEVLDARATSDVDDEPCDVCGQPIDSGDEPGWPQDEAGSGATCSVACTEVWYANRGPAPAAPEVVAEVLVGLPVAITVLGDGTVRVSVDLAEAGAAALEDPEQDVPDEVVLALDTMLPASVTATTVLGAQR